MNFVPSCYLDELNGFYFYNFLKVKVTQPVLNRTILLMVSSKWISITLVWIGRSSISLRLVNSFIGQRVFIIFYLLYYRILFLYTAGSAVSSSRHPRKLRLLSHFPLFQELCGTICSESENSFCKCSLGISVWRGVCLSLKAEGEQQRGGEMPEDFPRWCQSCHSAWIAQWVSFWATAARPLRQLRHLHCPSQHQGEYGIAHQYIIYTAFPPSHFFPPWQGHLHNALVEAIRPHEDAIRTSPCCKRISRALSRRWERCTTCIPVVPRRLPVFHCCQFMFTSCSP